MSRLLIDTSAYSGFKRGQDEIVRAVQEADRLFLNGIVLGELRAGFILGNRSEENEAELQSFLRSPRVEVLSIDEETSHFCAAIYRALRQAGTPIPSNDLWISASAMQHGLCVLTTDSHFKSVQQILVRCLD